MVMGKDQIAGVPITIDVSIMNHTGFVVMYAFA